MSAFTGLLGAHMNYYETVVLTEVKKRKTKLMNAQEEKGKNKKQSKSKKGGATGAASARNSRASKTADSFAAAQQANVEVCCKNILRQVPRVV